MSDYDEAINFDTCSAGFAGMHYCSRIIEAQKRIAELEQELAEAKALLGKWISYDGYVCPSCGRPHGTLEND